jgi:F-type H+-transporting ATPase subunit gamma
MASAREMRLRIRSVKNISQVTRALEAVSASKVRKAIAAVTATRNYSAKAWQVLSHIARQPGLSVLHPLLVRREKVRNILVVLISGDRGLAGVYNTNVIRFVSHRFDNSPVPVRYIAVGRKGRDLLLRRKKQIVGEFANLPAAPSFGDVSAIGRMAVEEFLNENADEVYLVYTRFVNMIRQEPVIKKLLPLEVTEEVDQEQGEPASRMAASYTFEPSEEELLDEIIPRFTALQVYQAILESLASEHAARMVAMSNATENAVELVSHLQMEYNKARQQTITNDLLDIAGGAEALARPVASE